MAHLLSVLDGKVRSGSRGSVNSRCCFWCSCAALWLLSSDPLQLPVYGGICHSMCRMLWRLGRCDVGLCLLHSRTVLVNHINGFSTVLHLPRSLWMTSHMTNTTERHLGVTIDEGGEKGFGETLLLFCHCMHNKIGRHLNKQCGRIWEEAKTVDDGSAHCPV